MTRITKLSFYPVKGMCGISLPGIRIDHNLGVINDRQTAFLRPRGVAENGRWASKANFYVGMNTPTMVGLNPCTPFPKDEIVMRALGLPSPPVTYSTQGKLNLTDTEGPTVTLLNMATVQLFEQFLRGKNLLTEEDTLNPERFRMNVQVDDWEPFAELDLATTFNGPQEITLGDLRFQVYDVCERCKATHADPETGTTNLTTIPLLMEFMDKYRPGYQSPQRRINAVMGLILRPLESGTLNEKDFLRVL